MWFNKDSWDERQSGEAEAGTGDTPCTACYRMRGEGKLGASGTVAQHYQINVFI